MKLYEHGTETLNSQVQEAVRKHCVRLREKDRPQEGEALGMDRRHTVCGVWRIHGSGEQKEPREPATGVLELLGKEQCGNYGTVTPTEAQPLLQASSLERHHPHWGKEAPQGTYRQTAQRLPGVLEENSTDGEAHPRRANAYEFSTTEEGGESLN